MTYVVRYKKRNKRVSDKFINKFLKSLKPGEIVRVTKLKSRRRKSPERFVTKNFLWSEFHPKGRNGITPQFRDDIRMLARALEELREFIGPIRINSGFRTVDENNRVGGASRSQHLYGRGADIKPMRVSVRQAAAAAERVPAFRRGGIGTYNGHLHVDIRGYHARWSGTSK